MVKPGLSALMEDHALESVPPGERENWLKIAWNTVGLITTLVIMFFGAVVCFVAGVKIALFAGIVSFAIGSALGLALARVTVESGLSNTLITRNTAWCVVPALASDHFGFLIVGFCNRKRLAVPRFLFFFKWRTTGSRASCCTAA
jgi:cytosine permease